MSLTHEAIAAAEQLMTDVQARVFFNKLASLGITAETDEQAAALWELGDNILRQRPRLSDAGRATKQASAAALGERCSAVASDGCSLDAHKIAEGFLKDRDIAKAVQILLAVNNT